MKILLCNPNTNLPIKNQVGIFKNTVAICAPLGIGYLASTLRKNGYETSLCDFFGASEQEIEQFLIADKPDMVGVSCFTEHRGASLRIARLVRKLLPSAHVVMGGSHATFYAEEMLRQYPEIDSIVMYEAEDALLDWVRCLDENRRPVTAPPGVAFRRDAGITANKRAPFVDNLDRLPFPVRDLNNKPSYKAYPPEYQLGRQATMMASRGCPYRCQYCSTTRFWGSKYRMRSVENVLEELQFLVEGRKMEYIHFFDDALTVKKEWILRLCSEIERRRLRFDWEAITRVNYVDADICTAMRRAGCRTVIFGVESFSDRILKSIHKGVTGSQAVNALKTAKKCGLDVTCLLMIGNPGECWETVRETIEAIRSVKPDQIDAGLTVILPKTELYEIATKAGFMDDSYWLDESLSAPVFTLENSLDTLCAFKNAVFDAQWSNNWFVRVYRGSGLRKARSMLKSAHRTRAGGEDRPLVWYMAQGYSIRGGHEAHILHYATELRNHGFRTCVVVPNPLPAEEHLFMQLLRERGIPLESVADSIRSRAMTACCFLMFPWFVRQIVKRRGVHPSVLFAYVGSKLIASALRNKIMRESPAIIHIFGRLAHNLWAVLPPERVVFHHATEGLLDRSWETSEIEAFRNFATAAARNFAPGRGVAENVRREFGITCCIDAIFTICPDEAGPGAAKRIIDSASGQHADIRRLRFGILCRFTEEKGISYLLDAIKRYRDKHGSVDFTFAGEGELEGAIREFVSVNNLENVGVVKVGRPFDILRKMDVFVHPSVTDAMPMAIAEALMSGCPCIVTNVGGIPDLVRDGLEGWVIEPRQSSRILECMERFAAMTDADLEGFHQRARSRYEAMCKPDKVGSIVAEHYRAIIAR